VKAGDIVLAFGSQPVTDLETYSWAAYVREPVDATQGVVLRDGKRVTLAVTLGKRGG
jgi:S1-C subfamily serine protease